MGKCRGTPHSLRPQQIAYVLPGGQYKEKDLHAIHTAAVAAASDKSLMELAWEVRSLEFRIKNRGLSLC